VVLFGDGPREVSGDVVGSGKGIGFSSCVFVCAVGKCLTFRGQCG
jgi:hypothetical protein